MKHEGFYKRKKLPHFNRAGAFQLITYRLADALPKNALAEAREKLNNLCQQKTLTNVQHYEKVFIEEQLDRGHGSCLLRYAPIAKILIENFNFFDHRKYELIAYTVMPSHVHILIQENADFELADVVYSWKSYTSKQILNYLESLYYNLVNDSEQTKLRELCQPLLETRKIWQEDFWDRCIRNEKHFDRAYQYILYNPVKSGLAKQWDEYPYTFTTDLQIL